MPSTRHVVPDRNSRTEWADVRTIWRGSAPAHRCDPPSGAGDIGVDAGAAGATASPGRPPLTARSPASAASDHPLAAASSGSSSARVMTVRTMRATASARSPLRPSQNSDSAARLGSEPRRSICGMSGSSQRRATTRRSTPSASTHTSLLVPVAWARTGRWVSTPGRVRRAAPRGDQARPRLGRGTRRCPGRRPRRAAPAWWRSRPSPGPRSGAAPARSPAPRHRRVGQVAGEGRRHRRHRVGVVQHHPVDRAQHDRSLVGVAAPERGQRCQPEPLAEQALAQCRKVRLEARGDRRRPSRARWPRRRRARGCRHQTGHAAGRVGLELERVGVGLLHAAQQGIDGLHAPRGHEARRGRRARPGRRPRRGCTRGSWPGTSARSSSGGRCRA